MDGKRLQEVAATAALALPGVDVSQPFGPGPDVFKVRGKMFALTGEAAGRRIVTVKAEPADGAALRQAHESILPGYHTNKRHWISVSAGPGITAALVEELVGNAYLLVVERLPKAERGPLLARLGPGFGASSE